MAIFKDANGSDLTEFAAEQQRRFDAVTLPRERKERGHFGTPKVIADYMSQMFSEMPRGTIRILDAGAGIGTLSAAISQRVLNERSPRHLEFELWETDPQLVSHIRKTMDYCRKSLVQVGHRLDYTIYIDDFILANSRKTLFEMERPSPFHLAILNPPYYKLQKESPQAMAMEHVVHGQPNIYALFMALAADMLCPGGEMVAITPRSYFNGLYFKRFRKWFFDRMLARGIHVFESRTAAFHGDEVLQENVILHAQKGGCIKNVTLTRSHGRDLRDVEKCIANYDQVIDNSSGDRTVRITANQLEREIVGAIDALPQRFQGLGFEISTGPVVTFRSTDYLCHEKSKNTAPLLWMHNVRPFITRFPARNGKPSHIAVAEGSMRLLVPAKRYVLLKRFTAKEEKRRLVAGIVQTGDSYSEWLGLENHLNYIYRKDAELTEVEAFGLAALFNSAVVDRYFRAISGNTQVNATEIRVMPMPDARTIVKIGELVLRAKDRSAQQIERIVGRCLRLPQQLIEQLCGVA